MIGYRPEEHLTWLRQSFKDHMSGDVIVSAGMDDCGVVAFGDRLVVLTADHTNASPHILKYSIGGAFDLGRLAVAAAVSDLVGTGAKPFALLLSVTFPAATDSKDYRDLIEGAKGEAEKWGVPIVGGDSKVADAVTCHVAAIGEALSLDSLFLSEGAKPGDDLWVSGEIGDVNAAVMLLDRGSIPSALQEGVLAAILEPELPLARSQAAAKLRLGGGGTDLSDGLVFNLRRICNLSEVGAQIDLTLLPISEFVLAAADELGLMPQYCALGLGGDFQFILAARTSARAELEALGFFRIGCMNENVGKVSALEQGRVEMLGELGHVDSSIQDFADEASRVRDPYR